VPEVRPGREGRLALVRAALAALEASRERIDDLNVYPVPDGDTGTNMVLTIRAAAEALERDPDADLTRALLMGARGNSGVILSQLVRGAVASLGEEGRVDAPAVARALRAASDAGYAAVRNAEEGTILTLARELAERAETLTESSPALTDALSELTVHGEEALARTQEQLDVLREAGVVDAGAAGLLEILRGITAHVRGEPLPEPTAGGGPVPLEAIHQELSRFRYCTSFYVEGEEVDPEALEAELGRLGDSLLVVGGRGAVKVHVHTDEPGKALALGTAVGVLEEVDVKNMHVQTLDRKERLVREEAQTSVVAVCSGAGTARLFESLGAVCVDGGETMNPATADLVAAIEGVPAPETVVLPNSKNVFLAAEQAAQSSAKTVHVLPTRSVQAGLGAMVAFEPNRSAEENAAEMEAAAAGVRAGAVTRASRTTALGGLEIEEGHFLGLLDGEPVTAGPTFEPVAREVAERALEETADVLTLLAGEGAEGLAELVEALREAHPELEIELHDGGQPHYPLLLAAE
jgi:DAK2 domain fusion protein YloV